MHIAQTSLNNWVRLATSDLQLENFVMLKWTEDQTVIPRESRFNIIGIMELINVIMITFSSWQFHRTLFAATLSSTFLANLMKFYLCGNHSFTWTTSSVFQPCSLLDLRLSRQGLRSLDESGKLTFFSVPGGENVIFTQLADCLLALISDDVFSLTHSHHPSINRFHIC